MSILQKILVPILVAMIPSAAMSQIVGDAEKGMQYAIDVCSECHAVRDGQPRALLSETPSFEDIANTSGMTAIALTVWFKSQHPSMPNIKMTDEEMRNVIHYIISLKNE